MPGYSIALFLHLLSLMLAVVGASLATYAALRLRAATTLEEAIPWLALTGKMVRVFPIATAGLLATGAYMTQSLSGWSEPWVLAALVGLGVISLLGAGVERSRGGVLKRELQASGLSDRARHLVRDPVAWSARLTTLTLTVAIMFVMTDKPAAAACAAALVVAVIAGVLAAMPFWNAPTVAGPVAEGTMRR